MDTQKKPGGRESRLRMKDLLTRDRVEDPLRRAPAPARAEADALRRSLFVPAVVRLRLRQALHRLVPGPLRWY